MRSPVSRGALGECNAITSRRSGHAGLTFVSALKTGFGAFDEPIWWPASQPFEGGGRGNRQRHVCGWRLPRGRSGNPGLQLERIVQCVQQMGDPDSASAGHGDRWFCRKQWATLLHWRNEQLSGNGLRQRPNLSAVVEGLVCKVSPPCWERRASGPQATILQPTETQQCPRPSSR